MIFDSTYFLLKFRGPNRLRFLKKSYLSRHFKKFGGINRSHVILFTRQHLLEVLSGVRVKHPGRGIQSQIYTQRLRGSLYIALARSSQLLGRSQTEVPRHVQARRFQQGVSASHGERVKGACRHRGSLYGGSSRIFAHCQGGVRRQSPVRRCEIPGMN